MEKALFIDRPNRFTIVCKKDNRYIKAYLPNPGRLWELLLPGRRVFIKRSSGKSRLLPYTVWAVEKNGHPVLLHTHYTNTVAEELILNRLIPGLEEFSIREKESRYANHRFDFLLENRKSKRVFLEVKSCTLFGSRIAMFPDAVTKRGRSHIETLANIGGGVLFVVHSPEVDFFLPEFHTDPEFSKSLYENRHKLFISAVALRWSESLSYTKVKPLRIPWYIYEKEAEDRGSYILLIRVDNSKRIRVGSIGSIHFRRGYYLYVGSAMGSLSTRINRHLRKKKPLRWHIDYLVKEADYIKALPIRMLEPLECLISEAIRETADDSIKGFGTSDCRCESHLYWMKKNPIMNEKFIEILMEYRIERLNRISESEN
jgi:sugar fermentation stimulation protein A